MVDGVQPNKDEYTEGLMKPEEIFSKENVSKTEQKEGNAPDNTNQNTNSNDKNTNTQEKGTQKDDTSLKKTKPRSKIHMISKATLFILFGLFVIYIGFITIKTLNNATPTQEKQDTQVQEPKVQEEQQNEQPPVSSKDGLNEYVDKEEEFLFSYPDKADLNTDFTQSNIKTYTITYLGDQQKIIPKTEKDLVDGYIFNLIINKEVSNTNLDQISLDKRNSYLINCPRTVSISNIEDKGIRELPAKSFEVSGCDQSFIETFFVKGNSVYEFRQVYRGDLGYGQKYRAETQDMIDSFRFTNIIAPTPKDTWELVKRDDLGISFSYPKDLDSTCCTIQGPIGVSADKVSVLAHIKNVSNQEKFDGMAVYVNKNKDKNFNSYLEDQKLRLKENYRLVINKNAETQDIETTVAGIPAILLKGYAWWGDMIFMQIPNNKGYYLTIVKTYGIEESNFDDIFTDILNTFGFFDATGK